MEDEERGWHSRGYLPHIDFEESTQFLTWHLADSIPRDAIERWRNELASEDDSNRRREIARRVEAYADAGAGSCLLANPNLARIVQQTLFHDDPEKYMLHAWVVMPNHVHVLLTPSPSVYLKDIVKAIKGVSAKRIGLETGKKGRVWQPDYFDRFVRDEGHFQRLVRYIEWNPVKAKLCADPRHYQWSSASEASLGLLRSKRLVR